MPTVANPAFSATVSGITITGSCGTAVDPATAVTSANNVTACGELPAACVYSAVPSDGETFPALSCNSTADNLIIKGINFGPVGGHKSTYLYVDNSVTGSVVVAFSNFEADESTYVRNGFANWEAQASGDIVFFANNMLGNWADDWSAQGAGTVSQSGTVLTVSACSVCEFRVGQLVDGTSVAGFIMAQLTGTPGGVGTYRLNTNTTLGSQAAVSFFQMGGGVSCNTTGNVVRMYNYEYQVNGRIGTCSQRPVSGTTTNIELTSNKYNYSEGCIYQGGAHYEVMEYVIQDGNRDITWDLMDDEGNVNYYPLGCLGGSMTATNFVSTGAINGTIDPNFDITYAHKRTVNNTVIIKSGNSASTALDLLSGNRSDTPSPRHTTQYTATGNFIERGGAAYYSSVVEAPEGTSFWTGPQSGGTLTVSSFSGGVPIAVGQIIWESGVVITAQLTGTAGGAGTYSYSGTCSISCSSGGRRSAKPAILAVTASGNYDITTGDLLTLPQYLFSGTTLSSGTYPGMR